MANPYHFNGSSLRNARLRAGLTQADISETLGVTQPAYSKWEGNLSEPPATAIFYISKILRIRVSRLFGKAKGKTS